MLLALLRRAITTLEATAHDVKYLIRLVQNSSQVNMFEDNQYLSLLPANSQKEIEDFDKLLDDEEIMKNVVSNAHLKTGDLENRYI